MADETLQDRLRIAEDLEDDTLVLRALMLEAADALDRLEMELDEARLDAARYRWLRAGNGYAPEESMIVGGADLDELCDDGIAADGVKL